MSHNDLFPTAAPDFSDPLGLLRACHERIFQHCELLERLARHLAAKGVDQEAREAAEQVQRYFSTAARHHHADEEEDLFPRLASRSPDLTGTIRQLEQEHQQLDGLWQELAPMLADLARIEDTAAFADTSHLFARTYQAHARKENADILDRAQGIFSKDELKQIGRSMAERRGIALPPSFQG